MPRTVADSVSHPTATAWSAEDQEQQAAQEFTLLITSMQHLCNGLPPRTKLFDGGTAGIHLDRLRNLAKRPRVRVTLTATGKSVLLNCIGESAHDVSAGTSLASVQ